VLVGRPNVGKSSFLNTLSGESRAIVSDIPGTTRDFLESRVTIEGFSVTLVNLPGIRENISDPIEKIAIERALQCIPEADMRIFFSSEQEKLCQKTLAFFMKEGDIIVFTKSDLYHLSNLSYYAVSSTLKTGFDQVLEAIKKRVKTTFDAQSDRVVVRKRHMESIINFKNSIKKTIYLLDSGYNFEILAEELRNSLDIIEELTGKITSERVMDAVFSEFCIGK
jgi:tRNA modification GTPase